MGRAGKCENGVRFIPEFIGGCTPRLSSLNCREIGSRGSAFIASRDREKGWLVSSAPALVCLVY